MIAITNYDQYPQHSGLYTIYLKDLDTSDLRHKLGQKLLSVSIVNENQLQLTFKLKGFSIDESKCELSRDHKTLTLMIRNHSQDYGSFHENDYSLKARYTIPKGVRVIKCYPL